MTILTVLLSIIRTMKRFLIVFLMFFVACSNGSEESNEVVETTTTTTQETTTTSTTSTTSTTTTMVEEEYEVDPPKVLITNCPTENINVDIYELEWTAEAGSGDIVYIGILVEKDDANFTRVFFTKEDNADLITFPTAYTSNSYSYQIDNTDSNVAASYIIEINIISEQPNGDQVSTYDLCYTDYSPPTTTTTSTSTTTTTTTTTTIPIAQLEKACFFVEEMNLTLPKLLSFKYLDSFEVNSSSSIRFEYSIEKGTNNLGKIAINFKNSLDRNDYGKVIQDFTNGLPLQGIIEVDISNSYMQAGLDYNIWSIQIYDTKQNQIEYIGQNPYNDLNTSSISNRVTGQYCELKHSFFGADIIFKIRD